MRQQALFMPPPIRSVTRLDFQSLRPPLLEWTQPSGRNVTLDYRTVN